MSNFNLLTILESSITPITWIVILGLILWKVSGWKATIDTWKTTVDARFSELSGKIDNLYNIIASRFEHDVQQTSSPVTLTDYGQKLSERIAAGRIVDEYAEELNEKTKGMNAYQIQEKCFSFCETDLLKRLQETDKQYFDEISKVAFDDGIKLEKITRVIGIELRDRVLSMCGKLHTEVDEHSPS